MFWLSGRVSNKIGNNGILAFSLPFYTMRSFICAIIENPWQALPSEFLRGLIFALFRARCTLYVYSVAPAGTITTILAVFIAVYHGMGQSTRALLGGHLIHHLGSIKEPFFKCGVVEAIVVAAFVLYVAIEPEASSDQEQVEKRQKPL